MSLPMWIKVHHDLPFSEQAARAGLSDRTLRRWALGVTRPRPTYFRDYLAWAVNEVFAPLDSTTDDLAASMPLGWRAYWACSPTSYLVLVVWRGRVVRHEIGAWARASSLDELRPVLVERVRSWAREAGSLV